MNWSWPPPFPGCPHGFTHLSSPESPDPVLPCSHHCLQSETAHTTSVCAFLYYPYKLNHRQLFLNSQAVFCLQTFKYTAPPPRAPFPVPRALSTPAGQQLLQEASTVLEDGFGALACSQAPYASALTTVTLPGKGRPTVLVWVSLCCCSAGPWKGSVCVEGEALVAHPPCPPHMLLGQRVSD